MKRGINPFKKGQKVHYDPGFGFTENGIVKEVRGQICFVVFHCGGDWDNYENYTGQSTYMEDIKPGWYEATEEE